MPRDRYKKRITNPDPVFQSYQVAKLINYLIKDGKKTVAKKIVYSVLEKIKDQNEDPLVVLGKAIENVAPKMEVKPRRLGGASYLVPVEVRKGRQLFLSLNWIIEAAKSRSNKEYHTFAEKLSVELIEAAKNQGGAVQKKLQTEKIAESNKAFAHLRW
jgi:small subunit ribosomal protein S7